MRRGWGLVTIASVAIAIALGAGFALPAHAEAHRPARPQEAICRMVDAAAENNRLPTAFLTRVLWQESRFRTDVTSPAGAAGVAQFMPETAAKRRLADPYTPARGSSRPLVFWPNLPTGLGISASPRPLTTPAPAGS